MVAEPRKWIRSKKKIALVLSGGGTKAAAFHIGVAFALREKGFRFLQGLKSDKDTPITDPMTIQTYVGSSAGAIVASFFASGYSLENITSSFLNPKHMEEPFSPKPLPRMQYLKMFRIRPEMAAEQAKNFFILKKVFQSLAEGQFPSLLQFRWLKIAGLFSAAGLEQFMREEVLLSNRFEDLRPELFIIANQLDYSRKVIFGKKVYPPPAHDPTALYCTRIPISEAIAASASLPVLFAPYPIAEETGENRYYIDGEIRETLSTHVAVDGGADLVIASYTHKPYRFVPELGSLIKHGLPAIVLQSIYILIEQKINSVLDSYSSKQNAIREVRQYCVDHGLSAEHSKAILELLEKHLHQKESLDIIPVHPDPSDPKTFIAEHFSLNALKLNEIVKAGYRAANIALSKYEFENHPEGTASGATTSP